MAGRTTRTHRIRRLPPEEARIDRGRNHHDPPPALAAVSVLLKRRQHGLHGGIQPLRIDALHQLEPPDRRILDRRPPDRARIVHQLVNRAVEAHHFVHELLDRRDIADVDGEGRRRPSGFVNLAGYGVDCR